MNKLSMDYKLEDLIDLSMFQNLQNKLNDVHSLPTSIIDIEGKVLTFTAWINICSEFHRNHPEGAKECIKSDKNINENLHLANPGFAYTCPHGLVDVALPIMVEGKHMGNFFMGQFFLEPPDIEFFKENAKKYGFDEKSYLEALHQVPILTKEQYDLYISLISIFTDVLSEFATNKLKEFRNKIVVEHNENKFHSVLESSIDGFFEVSEQGEILTANHALCKITGYSKEELTSLHVSDIDINENKEDVQHHLDYVFKNFSDSFETKYKKKNGEIIDVEIRALYIPLQGKKTFSFIRDITEQKRITADLKINEEKYRNLVNGLLEGLVIIDFQGTILYMNPAVLTIFGYEQEDMNSLLNTSFTHYIDPEFLEAAFIDLQRIYNGESMMIDYKIIKKDGSSGWIQSRGVKIDYENSEADLILFHDITKEKNIELSLIESELKFSTAFHLSPVAMTLTLASTGQYYDVNEIFLKDSEYSREEIMGKNSKELGIFADDTDREKLIAEVAKSGKIYGMPFTARAKSGILKDCLISSSIVSIGETKYYLSTTIDITDRKKAEEALRKEMNRLELLNSHMVDREVRMVELKKEINSLLIRLGEPAKY